MRVMGLSVGWFHLHRSIGLICFFGHCSWVRTFLLEFRQLRKHLSDLSDEHCEGKAFYVLDILRVIELGEILLQRPQHIWTYFQS